MSRVSIGLANEPTTLNERVIVATTEADIALTQETHQGRLVVLNLASTNGQAITLPAARGTGDRYFIYNNVVQTQVITITPRKSGDVFVGVADMIHTTAAATSAESFAATATDDVFRWRGTDGTTGGKRGDVFEAVDIAAGSWLVRAACYTTGAVATPFASS